MKKITDSKYLLPFFLIILFIVNLIQGFTTELIADEAYYWTYSNELDWGYFDHPPMVAIWITISKFFFSEGELSVRFFSSITLSLSFYVIWLTITNPKKHSYTWWFILIILSTALFNAYGFITVPDTPLMLFTSFFLLGYRKYTSNKSFLSYFILALSMTGMLYSKYQSVLIILFVLISNLKVLKDGKIWLTTLTTLLLYSPHLYWQFINDFPSFKYHLFERKESTVYRFRDTYMHLVNMIAIIGFTFPIVYKSLFNNLKTKDTFQKALNFLTIGFIVFFFITTFKGHAQAQWIVPISIPLIIITFNFLIENKKSLKTFKILACISIFILTFLRLAMANEGILPKQFEMHGNKKWVSNLHAKIKEETPLFLNSYQNTSLYWFYSGKRPFQYNSWSSRKNQYDLYSFNQNITIDNPVIIESRNYGFSSDSLVRKNNDKLYLNKIKQRYTKMQNLSFSITPIPLVLKENSKNSISVRINNPYANIKESDLFLSVILKFGRRVKIIPATYKLGKITFFIPKLNDFAPSLIQIIGTLHNTTKSIKLSKAEKCTILNE